jgi:hypothetical protein
MDVKVGVINPYALGEMIADKNIKWNSVPEPQKMLSEILNIEEDEIFDIKNPILNPNIQVEESGKVKVLSETQAKKRVDSFLKEHTPGQKTRKLAEGLKLSAKAHEKLSEMFISSAVMVSESSTPWKPTDKEWIDKGDYFEDVAEFNDPIQGALGDCYYIAALSSVSWARPYVIINMIRPSAWGDDDNPIHRVDFYKNGTKESVEVSENVPVAKTSHSWIFARSLDLTEIWPAVMEKAYAKWRTNNNTDYPNYPAISGGDPVMACAQLIHGTRTYKGNSSTTADELWNFVRRNSLSRRTVNPMVAWTYSSQPAGTNYNSSHVVANHAYSVLGWDYFNNEKYIVLRNPWGTHHATLDTRMGTWYAYQISNWASVSLNTNGVFSIKASTFKKYFAGIGVAV